MKFPRGVCQARRRCLRDGEGKKTERRGERLTEFVGVGRGGERARAGREEKRPSQRSPPTPAAFAEALIGWSFNCLSATDRRSRRTWPEKGGWKVALTFADPRPISSTITITRLTDGNSTLLQTIRVSWFVDRGFDGGGGINRRKILLLDETLLERELAKRSSKRGSRERSLVFRRELFVSTRHGHPCNGERGQVGQSFASLAFPYLIRLSVILFSREPSSPQPEPPLPGGLSLPRNAEATNP